MATTPRGIRNNNPLNLRRSSTAWLGKFANPADSQFEQFDTMLHGIRAAFVCMFTHINRDLRLGIPTTLASEITRWAPSSENNTATYIAFVARRSGISPQRVLKPLEASVMVPVVRYMALFETGQLLSESLFIRAHEMAVASAY